MALVVCPECEKLISDRAKACPHCGFPMEEHMKSNDENKTPKTVDDIENLVCPKCGAQYYKGHKFCRKCGNPIMEPVESAPVSDGSNIIKETVSADDEDNTIIVDNVENQNQKNKYPRFNFPDNMSDEEKQNIVNKASELKEGLDNLGKKMGIPPKDFIPVPNEPCAAPSNLTVLKNEMQRLLNYFSERTVDFQMYKSFLKQFNSLLEGGSLLFACAVGGFLGMFACLFIYEMSSDNHMGLLMEWFLFMLFTVIIYVPAKKVTEKKKVELTDNLMFLRKKLIWHYNNATNCFINYDYCDPVIISAMYNNLISGRATTYASALNVYLSDETTRMMIQKMNEQFEKMERDIDRIHREIRRDMNNRRY